ncbi:MAG: hypothetical protein AAF734_12850 [Bacteroidota bacterium]
MDTEELQLGNYVSLIIRPEILQVKAISQETTRVTLNDQESRVQNHTLRGVEINAKWLVELGFAYHQASKLYKLKNTSHPFLVSVTAKHLAYLYFRSERIKKLYYVHQLQNVYSSMCQVKLVRQGNQSELF